MKWSYLKALVIILLVGLLLAATSVIYLFFNIFNLLDAVIFLSAGYLLGRKVAGSHWAWGLLLALPSLFLNSYFVYKNGYSNLVSGIGTSYLISLFLVPFSACLGVAIAAKRDSSSAI